jgi:hypothetical protein
MTKLIGGGGAVLRQAELVAAVEGAVARDGAAPDARDVVTFYTRQDRWLEDPEQTPEQRAIVAAVLGCIDVMFALSKIDQRTRDFLKSRYGIDAALLGKMGKNQYWRAKDRRRFEALQRQSRDAAAARRDVADAVVQSALAAAAFKRTLVQAGARRALAAADAQHDAAVADARFGLDAADAQLDAALADAQHRLAAADAASRDAQFDAATADGQRAAAIRAAESSAAKKKEAAEALVDMASKRRKVG